ncbi:hypothetical protein SAMN02745866_01855 [Alteromonadaceae bacterium Bs31]|nr:hypothetical protein SAMN02745866_01855 [Alteromonadaceae bacterium Bs31]
MKNVMRTVKQWVYSSTEKNTAETLCNYKDNYYGDKICK